MRGVVLVTVMLFSTPSWSGELPRGLVGFSTATAQGDAGVLGMTAACQADFPTSRMCTSVEVLATQTVPVLPAATMAWVHPVLSPTGNAGIVDATGQDAVNCIGWSQLAATGLGVDDLGSFRTGLACATPRPVACCAAQPQLLGDINQDGSMDLVDSVLARRFLAGEVTVLP